MGWPADVPAAAHVFVGSADGLTDSIELDGDDGHHLARVLRLRVGESVTVADGSGRWRPYRIGAAGSVVRLEAIDAAEQEPDPSPRLVVAFALTKADKPDLVVQKLTELGVDRIVPVLSERSVARPGTERAQRARERWQRIAREAAGQSRRARLPVIEPLGRLADLAGHPALVVAERGGLRASALGDPLGGELLVLVGPEGGFAPEELAGLSPWARLGLGPHVLRAETAAVAAAAVLAAARR